MEPDVQIFLILFALKIIGMLVCSSKAKELNRNSGGWFFFGFVLPDDSIIINSLTKA